MIQLASYSIMRLPDIATDTFVLHAGTSQARSLGSTKYNQSEIIHIDLKLDGVTYALIHRAYAFVRFVHFLILVHHASAAVTFFLARY
jgi:hypothetical protein